MTTDYTGMKLNTFVLSSLKKKSQTLFWFFFSFLRYTLKKTILEQVKKFNVKHQIISAPIFHPNSLQFLCVFLTKQMAKLTCFLVSINVKSNSWCSSSIRNWKKTHKLCWHFWWQTFSQKDLKDHRHSNDDANF